MERWQRVRDVFDRAADLPAAERRQVVEDLCTGDLDLRSEVLDLLASLDRHGDRLEHLRLFDGLRGTSIDSIGVQLGAYRLFREVGQGGMGTVFEAIRADHEFERRVAIKILRRGAASEGLVRRFRQERQILAGMDHPNIARLLDGGSTEDGRPYLVMEYVDGEPITEYSRGRGLSVPDRLRLFCTLCDAVQHAHRHLVVHRDLKPGNVLVSSDGVVKLLDFGVAKLMPEGRRGGGQEQVTVTQQRLLTPGYASPEQIRGEPITTASDVYSLGVILYELLADRHPFDLDGASPFDLARMLETEPELPSQLARKAAGGRNDLAAGRMRRAVAGELDNIVLKALRKDPSRRYGSVDQLSHDIRRYLEGRPVLAQPDQVSYRVRKFLWRHRVGVAAAVVVILSLVGGAAGSVIQGRQARVERDRAQAEAARARAVIGFLADMLRAPDPRVDGRDVRVADLLAAAAERSGERFQQDRETLAEIQTAIGLSYAGLGLLEEAEPLLAGALRIRRASAGAAPALLAASLANYGSLLTDLGQLDAAESVLLESRSLIHPASRDDSVQLMEVTTLLGSLATARGAWADAEREHGQSLELARRLLGAGHPSVAASLNNVAVARGQQGDFAAAEALHREALEIQRAADPDSPDFAAALTSLATIMTMAGRLEPADSLFREALALRYRLLGGEHPDVAWTLYSHADLLLAMGDLAGAERNSRQVLSLRGRTLPDGHPIVAASLQVLGRSLSRQARFVEAEVALRESLTVRRAVLQPGHWLVASAESILGEFLSERGDFAEAEQLLLSGYHGLLETSGQDHRRTTDAAQRLVQHYTLTGDTAAAAAYRRRQTHAPEHP
jgi:eukaryotic-like serine/threonine-protein kinase